MVLVLVVGDLHIPYRASDIPEVFKKMFVPGKIGLILITGNITSAEQLIYFRTICSNVKVVRGDCDDYANDIPESEVMEVGDLKIGLMHGHQIIPWGDKESLAMVARRLDVDVLITGHTHQQKHFEADGRLFVNPGSLTGAFSPFESDIAPQFVLMDIADRNATAYLYSTPDGTELKVKRKPFTKPA